MAAQQEIEDGTYYNNPVFAHTYAEISPRIDKELPKTTPGLGYADLARNQSLKKTQNVKKRKRAFCMPTAMIVFGVLVVAIVVILGMLIFTGKDILLFH